MNANRATTACLAILATLSLPAAPTRAADPPAEMFLTRATYQEFAIGGRKQKRWAPTDDKIGFAWSDQPFAVHIPFDMRTKTVASRPRPGDGAVDAVTSPANRLRLHLRGFSADGVFGLGSAPILAAGYYRVDGAPASQYEPTARFAFVDRYEANPPNLDLHREPGFKPPELPVRFTPTGQTRYVYWVVLDPRVRRLPNEEYRYSGYEVSGVSRDYWAKHAECKGTFHAAIDGEDGGRTREAKLDIGILQNSWQVTRVKEELVGDWKQEVDEGWRVADVSTEWKDSTLRSTHRLSSASGQTDVTLSVKLPAALLDCQPARGSWAIAQTAELRNQARPKFGLAQDGFGALRVYKYADDPKAPPTSYVAGPGFRGGNGDPYLPLYTSGDNSGEIKFAAARPADGSIELSRGQTVLPAEWTADQATREYRVMSLDLLLATRKKPRPADAPRKRIDVFARRYSEVKDNRTGAARRESTTVVSGPDDGYHHWTLRFEELKSLKMARFEAIVAELEALHGMRKDKRRQFLTLLRLDQMSFPDDPAARDDLIDSALRGARTLATGGDRLRTLQYTTRARLDQMRKERETLKAEMAAVRPKQEPLVAEGLRLMKELTESIEGQMIASRDVYPRPELKQELREYQDILARAKLTLYDAAGWHGPGEFEAVAREYRYEDDNVQEWAQFLRAKIALARAEYLEENLQVLYAMPNKPGPDNPMQAEAFRARLEAMTALREVVRLNPDHQGARGLLSRMELQYLNVIAGKLAAEQQMTFGAFKQYLKARGYSADDPKGWHWQAYEVAHVIWGESISMIGSNVEQLAFGDRTLDVNERDAARVQADIAKYHVSLNLIKTLVRNGIPMATIRHLSADELGKFYRTHTAAGAPLDPAKVHRLCQDVHETFAYLPDLRALADGDADQLGRFLSRSYFDMLDPAKSWAEAGGDFFFSPASMLLFHLGGATVRGIPLNRLLAESRPVAWLGEKIAARPAGKWLMSKFQEDLELYNQYSRGRRAVRDGAGFAATLLTYGAVSEMVRDVPGIHELVDIISALGPFELTYEILARKGVPAAQLETAFEKARRAAADAKADLAKQREAIEKLEQAAKTITGPNGTIRTRPTPQQAAEIERVRAGLPEGPKTLSDPNMRAMRKATEAIESSARALLNGDPDEAARALKAAREFNRRLEARLAEFEAKLQAARQLLAKEGLPPLTDWQKKDSKVVGETYPTPWVPKDGYPAGQHGDFLRMGDLALVRGDLKEALDFYRASLKAKRMGGLAAPKDLIEGRVQLAEQALQKVEELGASRARALHAGRSEMIAEQGFLSGVASGEFHLEVLEGEEKGKNPIFFVKDRNGKTKFLFKAPAPGDAVELNLEALSTEALRGVEDIAPQCRLVRQTTTCKYRSKTGNVIGEVELTGILTEFHEGAELWKKTEAELVALKADLAKQRVLRLWLGDIDGHLRNIRLGTDGKLKMIDFGYAQLSRDPLHPVYDYLKQRYKNLDIKLPSPSNQKEFLESILMFPDVVQKTPIDFAFYGWMRRVDEMLNYDDMEKTVAAIKELCYREDGMALDRALKAAGVPEAEWREAWDVLRQRSDLLDGLLKKRFPTLKKPGAQPRSERTPGRIRFDPAFTLAA